MRNGSFTTRRKSRVRYPPRGSGLFFTVIFLPALVTVERRMAMIADLQARKAALHLEKKQ
jgi:hypothetical protein